ncbi:hypothetical protein C5U48_12990 [Mycolicibacter virginiensis]|uniref:Uncharacterized protein n=1 Tax=Mycolicibacter virginiensis TaxID=1795032 RepID=A0A9X7NYC2_9MYCO|nr:MULTISPECIES: hypothetical protein [Mycobacteriaceae]PQM51835.1 hypothetical protein C5U48_12990 [Mycolicibacter virginiensis]
MSLLAEPYHLDAPEKLLAVLLEYTSPADSAWRGGVHVSRHAPVDDEPVPAEWVLDLVNNGDGKHVSARMGQWMVVSYGQVLVLDEVPEGA